MDETVVVAGGGLAGLVAARHLAAAGADVTVYERQSTVGGRVRTERRDGFTFDRGFQVLLTGYPAVRRELDLGALNLRYFRPGAVIARPGRRWPLSDPLRDPEAALATLRNPEVTATDKLRTLALRQHVGTRTEAEIFRSRDRSIREFLDEWGFSEGYVENFVAPFYGGITLDRSLTTSKRVFEYTFKALSDGNVGVPADGMQAVPEQLADRAREAGADVVVDAAVESVTDRDDGVTVDVDGESVEADAVVVATDPKEARRLTGVEAVPTAARGCVTQYYRLPAGTDLETGTKLLLNAGGDAPNTVAPMSAVAPEYAPADAELVNATFLGSAAHERDASDLAAKTRQALESWYADRSFEALEPVHTSRVEFAQFDQPPGVHETLPGHRDPGGRTYLAGDYTAWSSIQGAMRSGREVARAVERDL
jgi:phytoene dehydrogenase-like protein